MRVFPGQNSVQHPSFVIRVGAGDGEDSLDVGGWKEHRAACVNDHRGALMHRRTPKMHVHAGSSDPQAALGAGGMHAPRVRRVAECRKLLNVPYRAVDQDRADSPVPGRYGQDGAPALHIRRSGHIDQQHVGICGGQRG